MDKQTGQLRDTFDILKDLAKVWNTLDANMQESIAFASAGTRQKSVFLDLMGNFSAVDKAVSNAKDSMGSALKENEVFMDSITGKLNQLKSVWSEFANQTIDSEFVKQIISLGTAILKLVTDAELLAPTIVGLGVAFTALKLAEFEGGFGALATSIRTFTFSTQTATIATTALGLALNLLIGGGIVLGIVAIAKSFDAMVVSVEEQEKKVQELADAYDELVKKKENLSKVEFKTEGQEKELANLERQLEVKKELQAIENERLALKQYDGEHVVGKGEWGDFQQTQTDVIKAIDSLGTVKQELQKVLSESSTEELVKSSGDDILVDNIDTLTEELLGAYNTLSTKLADANEKLSYFTNPDDIEKHKVYIADLENIISLIGLATTVESPFKNMITEEMSKQVRDVTQATREQVDALAGSLAIQDGSIKTTAQATEAQRKWRNEIISVFPSLGSLYGEVESGTDTMEDQIATYEELVNTFDDISGEIDFLSKTLKELNDDHTLSASTITKLANDYPQLLKHMGDEEALNQALVDIIGDKEQAQIDAFESMAISAFENSDYMLSLETGLREGLLDILNSYHTAKAEGYEGDLQAYAKMEQQKAKISEKLMNELKKAWAKYFGSVSDSVGRQINSVADLSSEDYNKMDKIQKFQLKNLSNKGQEIAKTTDEIINNMLESIDITIDEVGGITRPKTKSDPKKSKDTTQKELDNLIKDIQAKRNTLDQEIAMMEERLSLSQLKGDSTAIDKYSSELAELLSQRKQLTEAENVSLRELKNRFTDKESQLKLDQLINENSKVWWGDRKSEYEQEIEMMERKYELQGQLLDEKEKDLDLQQALLDSDSSTDREAYMALELERYDLILARQNQIADNLSELYALGIDLESSHIKELKDMYYDLEKQRLGWIKERAESERKHDLDVAKEKLDTLKKQEEAIKSLTDVVVKMLKHEAKLKKEALQEELDGYKKIIDKKKEMLDEEKNERDYNKGLGDRKKEISQIEAKLLELSLDNSAKAQAEKIKLEEELLKLKQDLDDYQYEHSIENQKDALDKEYDDFKENIDEKIDGIDDYLEKEGALREEAMKLIEKNEKELYNKLMKWGAEYSELTRGELQSIWEKGYEAMDAYNNGQSGVLETLDSIISSMRELNEEIEKIEKSSWSDYVSGNTPSGGGGTGTKPPISEGENKWSVEDAKKDIQQKEQQYFHKEMLRAKDEGNKGLEKWIREERKRWKMNPDSGEIETAGFVPEDAWLKKKKNYGFKRGGETQFTGLHWLDGEKGKPERILDANQTLAFNKLVEIAPKFNSAIEKVIELTQEGNGLSNLLETSPKLSTALSKILGGGLDNRGQGNTVAVNFENMINIEGNVDKPIDLEEVVRRASKQAIKDLQNTLSNIGISPKFSYR